jgi:transglutaminase-like putative cysteine protease
MSEQRFVDHETIDWAGVVAVQYHIEQAIRYEYPAPIRDLRHRLVISPRVRHGDQRRVSHDLAVFPDVPSRLGPDSFGNEIVALNVPYVAESIAFVLHSTVVRDARLGPHLLAASAIADRALRGRRRLIRLDATLADAAADLRSRHASPRDLAEAIVRFVHREMIYTKAVTDIFTTASVAFRMRRGVCQDYAHVAIALARACGLAARYVSGHLLGEGATHAWVEFLIPVGRDAAEVLSFDPTTGRHTDWRYLVVAVGRDYEDVAPTSGVFTGEAPGRFGAQQAVRITSVTRAA